MRTLDDGLSGLENLALIPGTVGAAPIQNIGAYGVEVGERVDAVEAFDRRPARCTRLPRDDCAFAYRDSLFKRDAGPLRRHRASSSRCRAQRAPNLAYAGHRATSWPRMGIARTDRARRRRRGVSRSAGASCPTPPCSATPAASSRTRSCRRRRPTRCTRRTRRCRCSRPGDGAAQALGRVADRAVRLEGLPRRRRRRVGAACAGAGEPRRATGADLLRVARHVAARGRRCTAWRSNPSRGWSARLGAVTPRDRAARRRPIAPALARPHRDHIANARRRSAILAAMTPARPPRTVMRAALLMLASTLFFGLMAVTIRYRLAHAADVRDRVLPQRLRPARAAAACCCAAVPRCARSSCRATCCAARSASARCCAGSGRSATCRCRRRSRCRIRRRCSSPSPR